MDGVSISQRLENDDQPSHMTTALPHSTAAKLAAAELAIDQALARHSPAIFTTSLGPEDQVVLAILQRLGLPKSAVRIVTLDTGRLPPETYELHSKTEAFFQRRIELLFPEAAAVEQLVRVDGIMGFRESLAQRKACCAVRKTAQLNRALQGQALWITGLRREQSETRSELQVLSPDDSRGLMKLAPLADWSSDDVWSVLKEFKIPTNALHQQGYPSIGCAPCTRAIQPGEPERAGRWWWESAEHKECGLHVKPQ